MITIHLASRIVITKGVIKMSSKELQEIKFPENKVAVVKEKAAITIPKNATVKIIDAANDEDDEDEVTGIGIASILQLHKGIQGEQLPKGKKSKIPEIESIFKVSDELISLNKKYKEEYVLRGTRALYEILGGIYALGVHIEESDFKEKVIAMMRDDLKDREIKTQSNTPGMTILIKYVVGADRQTAANYSRVLTIAMLDKVPVEELAEYISRRGGISQIHDIESKSIAKKLGAAESKERIDILREIMILTGHTQNYTFNTDIEVLQHSPEKNSNGDGGSFCFFMTLWDYDAKKYKIVSAHDLGSSLEDSVLSIVMRGKPNNLNRLRKGLRAFQDSIIKGEIGTPSLASRCERYIKEAEKAESEKKDG